VYEVAAFCWNNNLTCWLGNSLGSIYGGYMSKRKRRQKRLAYIVNGIFVAIMLAVSAVALVGGKPIIAGIFLVCAVVLILIVVFNVRTLPATRKR